MNLTIKKAVLHILDAPSNMMVISTKYLDLFDEETMEFVSKHAENSLRDAGRHQASFTEHSPFLQRLRRYVNGELDLLALSSYGAEELYEQSLHSNRLYSLDVIMMELSQKEEEYLGILCLRNKTGYTHQVNSSEDGVQNRIIRHYSILPSPSQKISSFAFIRLSDFSITFSEQKCMIDGEPVLILPERVLQCTWKKSSKETVKLINKIASKVAEEHGSNSAVAVLRAKSYMSENAQTSDMLSPIKLGRDVFSESSAMENEFRIQLQEAGLERPVHIDRPYAQKSGRSHKIKTDTGIEITIPIDYFDNERYVEFINNPDGTLSISLKNIAKITNRQS